MRWLPACWLPVCCLLAATLWSAAPLIALAQDREDLADRITDRLRIADQRIEEATDGVLTLMAFTALPDVTTSSLSIENAQEGDPGLQQATVGGGFTLSESVPLYLEGTIGYSRFDPKYLATGGRERRRIPLRWNTFAATGGVGWDFPLIDSGELVLRPIVNFTLGHASSDVKLGQRLVNLKLDRQINIIDGGDMNAWGLGGAIMLDYERFHPDGDIDVEVRYTNIQLRTFDTDEPLEGRSEVNTAGIWGRWRAPTGLVMLDRPLRYVLESSFTTYFGEQRGALGFNHLTSVGAGFELDSSKYPIIITRTRLIGRYIFGENATGYSLGLAVSF